MPEDAFAELLRQLRREAGRTQDEQADAINAVSGRATMTRREVSRYESGKNVPTDRTLGHIAAACGVPLEPLLREANAARARRKKREDREAEDQDDVKRRTLLETAIAGAAAAAEPWGRLAYALTHESRIDFESVSVLIDHAAQLHVAELNETARSLQSRVEAHLDAITAVLPRAGAHERALTIAAGETAALAGWVAWDLGEHEKAAAYYRATEQCANQAGHPPLRALALGYASYGAPTPARAMELLSQASLDARGPGNATAAAWTLGRLAEEAAQSGDKTGALRALDQARFAYDFADHTSEQAWVRFVTPYRMDSMALSVYGELKHHELATTADHVVEGLGEALPDSGVVVLGDLAAALLRGGDMDRGIHVARQFASAAESKPNTMGRQRARSIAVWLPNAQRDLASHLLTFAA
jgi:transcriptional regulator with XRE-family HTH domain